MLLLGFIPRLNIRYGQRYTVLATEGLAEFERQQLRHREALNKLRKIIDEQSRRRKLCNSKERSVRKEIIITGKKYCKIHIFIF